MPPELRATLRTQANAPDLHIEQAVAGGGSQHSLRVASGSGLLVIQVEARET